MKRNIMIGLIGTLALLAAALVPQLGAVQAEDENPQYEVKATGARLVRQVTGEVTNEVQSVAAEPVDSFVWDGESVQDIEGEATLEIDPVANTGEIKAEWTDPDGNEWTLTQTAFGPEGVIPPHPTGYQVGSTMVPALIEDDPVVNNVYLHGDTTAGGPVLSTIFNYLATWGPAEVTLNGELFENPFDGPTPLWVAHTMVTAGVRDADGQVKVLVDGEETPYDPSLRGEQAVVDDGDLEFHVVFHDAPGPEMTDNFPPPLSFFYHVQFEDVQIEIK